MNLEIITREQRKEAWEKFAILYKNFTEFSYNKISADELKGVIKICNNSGISLPSGRWGTPLAVALEMNNYIVAKEMIDNSTAYQINLSVVSSELGGLNTWDAKACFEDSISYYSDLVNPDKNWQKEISEKYPEIAEKNKDNLSACKELSKCFYKLKAAKQIKIIKNLEK